MQTLSAGKAGMAHRMRIRSSAGAAVLSAAFAAIAASQVPAPRPSRRIVLPIDDNQSVTLAGNVPLLARPEFDMGVADPDTRLDRMVLLLDPSSEQQTALDALVQAQQDPLSPLYHRWLTPAQYGARFGISDSDMAQVSAWLASQGFTIEEVPAGRRLIVFAGTTAQTSEAFHVEMHRYRVNGVYHIANSEDPQIPAALAGVVGGVVSLNDFRHLSEIANRAPVNAALVPHELSSLTQGTSGLAVTKPATPAHSPLCRACTRLAPPQFTSGGNHYLFPADFATIYDLNPLYQSSTTGTGISIAIAGRSNINLSDVTAFRAAAGLPANAPTVILDGANPGLVSGDQDEATLDVEWSGAVAPAASVKLVTAASTSSTDGVDLSAEYIVNHASAPIVSVSYGSCEQQMGSTELAFYNSLWEQAASEGISVFVASGDSGAAGCSAGSDYVGTGKAVNGLCSSPYSTCVGGTEFNEETNGPAYWSAANSAGDSSALQYIPEEVWNESGLNGGSGLWASGGGASAIYAQPSWQAAAAVPAANGMRAVPDVSLSAASHDGYILYEDSSYWIVSGTSAATPSFAGVMALVVESRKGAAQGCVNSQLYTLADAEQDPFHPTPGGSNTVPGVTGFSASGAVYNLATGLGSVDAALLVGDWDQPSSVSTAPDFTLSPSVENAAIAAGNSVAFSIAASESNSTAHAIALTAAAPAGISIAFSSATLLPGAPVTVTVTASSGAAPGTQTIAILGSDASGTQTVDFALTVTVPPSLVLSAASSAVTLARNGSSTLGFAISTGGTFAGQIAFSASGLPSGISASWSANPTALVAGLSSTPVKLILTASPRTAPGSFKVTVTASGDGLSVSERISLIVAGRSACRFSLMNRRCNPSAPIHTSIFR
jgi:subtilase family serine protease